MIFKDKISQIVLLFAIIQVFLCFTCDAAANDVSDFESRLYSNVVSSTTDANIFYSSLFMKACLSMARLGAVKETAADLDKALASSGQEPKNLADEFHDIFKKYNDSTVLKIANKMYFMKDSWARKPFHKSLTEKFFAAAASVNFAKNIASAKAINLWAKRQTNISNLISADQLNGDTRLVIVNAIRFKAEWTHAFDESLTSERDFIVDNKLSFKAKMMTKTGDFKFGFLSNMEANAVEIPCKDSNLSMVLIRPFTGLSVLEAKLSTVPFTDITNQLRVEKVVVEIPRFKIEFSAEFNKPLMNMGLERIFSNNAQFDNMLRNAEGLKVNKIVQKSTIEVSEKGTVPAVATVGVMYDRSDNAFVANVPFYFAIVDEKKNKIFDGRINGKFDSYF